jgi:hypothetical protein
MSLVRCADCGNDVSTRALTCPRCGAPNDGYAAKPSSQTPYDERFTAAPDGVRRRRPLGSKDQPPSRPAYFANEAASPNRARIQIEQHDEGSLKTPAYLRDRQPPSRKGVIVGLAILFVPLALLMVLFTPGTRPGDPSATTRNRLGVGHEAKVTQSIIFVSERALSEARDAGNNRRALAAMALGGQMIGVEVGTRVVILATATGDAYLVRVIEGEMTGRSGYVPRSFLTQ